VFQAGELWPFYGVQRRRRAPGKRAYHLSHRAYQQRLRAQLSWKRRRSYEESQRLIVEIVLGSLRGEPQIHLARRLGVRSHGYCGSVARRYKEGRLPMLATDEQGLVAMLALMDGKPSSEVAKGTPWWLAKEWADRDEIWACNLITFEQKRQALAEYDRRLSC